MFTLDISAFYGSGPYTTIESIIVDKFNPSTVEGINTAFSKCLRELLQSEVRFDEVIFQVHVTRFLCSVSYINKILDVGNLSKNDF